MRWALLVVMATLLNDHANAAGATDDAGVWLLYEHKGMSYIKSDVEIAGSNYDEAVISIGCASVSGGNNKYSLSIHLPDRYSFSVAETNGAAARIRVSNAPKARSIGVVVYRAFYVNGEISISFPDFRDLYRFIEELDASRNPTSLILEIMPSLGLILPLDGLPQMFARLKQVCGSQFSLP